jgi:adenylate cyclase
MMPTFRHPLRWCQQNTALLVGFAIHLFILFNPPLLWLQAIYSSMDNLNYDLRFRLRLWPPDPQESSVVIVDVDEASLQRIGHWPWPRDTLAQLTRNLFSAGSVVIGFDFIFPEKELNPVEQLLQHRALPSTLRQQLTDLQQQLDGDQHFAEALRGGDTVLPLVLHNAGVSSGVLPQTNPIKMDRLMPLATPNYQAFTANLPILQQAATSAGSINILQDNDGIVRRAPLLIRFGTQIYPSLSLEMVRLYLLADSIQLNTYPQGQFAHPKNVQIERISLPLDAKAEVLIPFQDGSHPLPYYSAARFLGPPPYPDLSDKLVILGTSAYGLHDIKATPLSSYYPGVEIHATLINAILHGKQLEQENNQSGQIQLTEAGRRMFPFRVEADLPTKALLLVLGCLVLIFPRLSPQALLLSTLGLVVLVSFSDFALFHFFGLVLSTSKLLLLITSLSLLNLAYGFLTENRRKLQLKARFGQYVPPQHVDAMLKSEGQFQMDGESRDMTVLFADIRSFTSISESLSANDLKKLLNTFFTPMTQIIFEHKGTIDKYVGDMIMAFWGAPLADNAHAEHAIDAALTMLQRLELLRPELQAKGFPEIQIGIGLNSGLMNVGDMGSEYRLAYTVLGDAVNLASRLEGQTKEYGVSLLIGEETFQRQQSFLCRRLDRVKVKGKQQAIQVYQPLCRLTEASAELQAEVAQYHQALDYYLQQNWFDAENLFYQLQQLRPEIRIYSIYLLRIKSLKNQILPENWDGVVVRTEK